MGILDIRSFKNDNKTGKFSFLTRTHYCVFKFRAVNAFTYEMA